MTAWSGIGFARGERLGHYQGLKNLGLHGCLFFVPEDDSLKSQADMEAYVAAAQEADLAIEADPWRPPTAAHGNSTNPSRYRQRIRRD